VLCLKLCRSQLSHMANPFSVSQVRQANIRSHCESVIPHLPTLSHCMDKAKTSIAISDLPVMSYVHDSRL
jgi:hypothetical protein